MENNVRCSTGGGYFKRFHGTDEHGENRADGQFIRGRWGLSFHITYLSALFVTEIQLINEH